MIYYKPIELDYYDIIVKKCLTYVKTNDTIYSRLTPATSWYNLNLEILKRICPELDVAFQKYDLIISMAAAFVMYNSNHASVHIDAFPSQARINIPLLNCANTYTNFYVSDSEPNLRIDPNTGIKSFYITGNYELVDRVEITQATVIRTKAPHSVDLPINNSVPRITLTLGFNKDPVFLLDT